jgi:hypothetical protein
MPILIVNLFWHTKIAFKNFRDPSALLIITTIFWAVFPWTNKLGYWDDFLSSEYYGGHSIYCYIDVPRVKAPKALSRYFIKSSLAENSDGVLLSVQNWSYGELHVPSYLSESFYKKVAIQWHDRYDSTSKVFIVQSLNKEEIKYLIK